VRYLEAYVGEYASGKSEVAINRALDLRDSGEKVTLVDLDLVEPFYTLRPLKQRLTDMGLDVIAWESRETLGLGEAGSTLRPDMRWVLTKPGHVILDVGYGVAGSRIFNLLEGFAVSALQVLAVVNIARPMTATAADIVAYLKGFDPLHGLVNNSHLGDETDLEIIRQGVEKVSEAGRLLNIPVVATTVAESFLPVMGERDHRGNPVRYLKRFMQQAYW
jgi:hypothetical protein